MLISTFGLDEFLMELSFQTASNRLAIGSYYENVVINRLMANRNTEITRMNMLEYIIIVIHAANIITLGLTYPIVFKTSIKKIPNIPNMNIEIVTPNT